MDFSFSPLVLLLSLSSTKTTTHDAEEEEEVEVTGSDLSCVPQSHSVFEKSADSFQGKGPNGSVRQGFRFQSNNLKSRPVTQDVETTGGLPFQRN